MIQFIERLHIPSFLAGTVSASLLMVGVDLVRAIVAGRL
jgi:hypothetical protein